MLRCVRRTPGTPITFNLAQVLSRHEAFGAYLHHFGILGTPKCPYCGVKVNDTEHNFLVCPHWISTRADLNELVGRQIQRKDIEGLLCGPDRRNSSPVVSSEFPTARRAFVDIYIYKTKIFVLYHRTNII